MVILPLSSKILSQVKAAYQINFTYGNENVEVEINKT